jgi:phage gp46-like protein
MRAEDYAEEALAWMKSDGIAAAIEAQSEIVFPNRLNLIIRYLPPAGTGRSSNSSGYGSN